MRKQLNYTCMLKNLLKLYCIWTWDTLCFGFFGAVLFYFMCSLWWDNYRATTEAPSPELEAETNTKFIKAENSLHLNLEVFFFYSSFCFILFYFYIFSFIYLFFISILLFILSIFYFQSSLWISNAFSAYTWLVHCLPLFISLKLFCLFLCFVFSTWLFVLPFSFNFFVFHPLSPFHSKYH
jgi:hypothetical protein